MLREYCSCWCRLSVIGLFLCGRGFLARSSQGPVYHVVELFKVRADAQPVRILCPGTLFQDRRLLGHQWVTHSAGGSFDLMTLKLQGRQITGFQSLLQTLLPRSEEHTSELQSRPHLVCRLLLEKKNKSSLR